MFIGNNFPELGTNLVAALPSWKWRQNKPSNGLQQKGIHIWHKHVPKLRALTSKGFLLTYISLKIWELRHSHSFIRMHGKEVARIVTIVNKHSFNLQKPYISYRRSYFTKFVPPTTAKHQTSGWFLWSLAILLPNSFEVGNFLSLHVHELTHGFKATDLERLQTLRCLRAVGRRNQTSQCKHGHPVKKYAKWIQYHHFDLRRGFVWKTSFE